MAISLMAVSPAAAQAKPMSQAAKPPALDIMLTQPTAVKAGDNQFEVKVKGADGTPVTGADVSVLFVMPAMPAMRMAEMRNEVKLKPAGPGTYAGSGNVDDGMEVERHGEREARRERARSEEADADGEVTTRRRATERLT